MRPWRLAVSLVALVTIGVVPAARAQGTLDAHAAAAVKITEARKANAALMRQYTWHSRTEISEEGEVKDTRIELINYGPDGQLVRTILNDYGAPLPIGFLRRAIAENKKQKLETYLVGLRQLIEQYTLPTTGKVLDFMTQASLRLDAGGLAEMTGHNVVVPGDTLSVWSDVRTQQTRRVQVTTTFQGDPVTVTATFTTIPSGLTYAAYAEVLVPSKQLDVKVQNFDYTRPN